MVIIGGEEWYFPPGNFWGGIVLFKVEILCAKTCRGIGFGISAISAQLNL